MEELVKFLSQINLLEKKQIDYIVSKFETKTLKTKQLFSEPNTIPNEIAFIKKGVFRIFYNDINGNEITKFIFNENNFIAEIDNFINNTPVEDCYIQSVTKSEILVISRANFISLYNEISNWDTVVQHIVTQTLYKKTTFLSQMLHDKATVRYDNFIKSFPNITNRIPLSFVASFLGVTQQSLSRIRKSVV